jgi:uncharacterized protein YkwD
MNWWLMFQVCQWVISVHSLPAGYLLRDDTFFIQERSQQLLSLENPDTLLLDMALFYATNEARRQAGVPILLYNSGLYRAAQSHAQSMILHDYYGHEDFYNLADLTAFKRVQNRVSQFVRVGENIGQYQTINTPDWFGARRNQQTLRYEYIDSETQQLYRPYTYASYARYAVQQWLNSPHHRDNLLNPNFTHVGCAARLSHHPFEERRAPFGRIVQNFGSLYRPTPVNR